MRMLPILLFVASLSVFARSTSQTVTLSGKDMSFKEIFAVIKKQTGFFVLANRDILLSAKPISLSVKDMPLTSFLEILGKEHALHFQVADKTVFLARDSVFSKQSSASTIDKTVLPVEQLPIRIRVRDENNQPLPGATITVKKVNKTSITDAEGLSTMSLEQGDVIIISFIGYETQTITVDNATTIAVTLKKKNVAMDEITVNAGYYSVKARQSTGNISKVTSATIEKQPVLNVLSALQGRVPGLDIMEGSGMPGAPIKIRLRGTNSIGAGNEPLFIIDGVPYSYESLGDHAVSRQLLAPINALSSINGMDVESIEVLKDADATAIYGSRGANGVILITTKKGRPGKTNVSVNLNKGFSKPARGMEMMNTQEYVSIRKLFLESNGTPPTAANAWDLVLWDTTRYTDWYKELIARNATRSAANVGISGGTESTNFLLSGNYVEQQGMNPGNFKYKMYSINFGVTHTSVDKRFTMNLSGNYASDVNNSPGQDIIFLHGAYLPPNAPALYNEDGTLNWANETWDNPVAKLKELYLASTNNLNASTNLSYKLLKNLSVQSRFGYSNYLLDEYFISPSTAYKPSIDKGSSSTWTYGTEANRNSWIIEPQLNWNSKIGKGEWSILVGGTVQKKESKRKGYMASDFASNNLMFDAGNARVYSRRSIDFVLYKYSALYGRINYNYDNRYIINATGRRDGSSRFGPDKQFANFGAVGAAWLFSRERWMQEKIDFLSFGKLRMSYGITGNDQIGDYEFLDLYGKSELNYGTSMGMEPLLHYNPVFGWETNNKLEFAVELGFLNDRLMVTGSYYRNRSSNQLVGLPMPLMTGFNNVRGNLDAVVQNRGIEVEIEARIIKGKDFSWTTHFNFSKPKNKLVAYPGLEYSTNATKYVIGQPLSIRRVYHYTGIDMGAGVYTFEDKNKDNKITALDDRDILFVGTNYFGGWNHSFQYKNFQLDLFLQYVNQTAPNALYSGSIVGGLRNGPKEFLSNWNLNKVNPLFQKLGTSAELRQASDRFAASDAVYVDASFVRLKNINLQYTVPQQLINLNAKVFIQAQNLLTFTKYLGFDPENASYSQTGPLKTWNFGLQITL